MGVIDLLIIVAVVIGCIWGAMKGVVRQISSLVAIVLGVLFGRMFGPDVSQMYIDFVPELTESENSRLIASILGHITVFVFVYLTISIIAMFAKSLLKTLNLGILDRIGGVIFCVFKFLLGLSLIFNVWLISDPDSSTFRGKKMLDGKPFKFTMSLAPWLLDAVGEECADAMQKIEAEIDKAQNK